MQTSQHFTFPSFNAGFLLHSVFSPKRDERIAILIDLPDPREMQDRQFYGDSQLEPQKLAFSEFYLPLQDRILKELGLKGGEMFAYRETGGSNLDFLDDDAYGITGKKLSLGRDIFSQYQIILCISRFSATAPLTALAREYQFRGATMHGLNRMIINSGLCVDYNIVSATAEKMRQGMTHSEYVEIDFRCEGVSCSLHVDLDEEQDAQKSHGLCPNGGEIANLPAGEIYFVPREGTVGQFPLKYDDGTIGLCDVLGGRIFKVSLIKGNQSVIDQHQQLLDSDRATGELGELGFGTQELPVSGRDIQDEKIFGTFHLATGRSDHLGGDITPDKFKERQNASHDDKLFSPSGTPEIIVPQVRMKRLGKVIPIIEHYRPTEYLIGLRR